MKSTPTYKTKKFRELKAKWYLKLKEQGFRDIEYGLERGMLDDAALTDISKRYNSETFEFKRRYYELALQLLHSDVFKSRMDKKVWKLHAEGKYLHEIAKEVGLSPRTIGRRIDYYAGFFKA